jgi:predicted phosphodiesterase
MKLLAISDLHVNYAANRQALEGLAPHPDDWLILAGDTGEGAAHLEQVLDVLVPRFEQIIWTPGNHDLWVRAATGDGRPGLARYNDLVARCRARGVLTPEDPWVVWPGDGPRRVIAPVFLLYDYSFRPAEVAAVDAVAWARASGVLCADERFLRTEPYASCAEWCDERVALTEARLEGLAPDCRVVLANHYPPRYDLADLHRVPRFSIWCGTRRTEDWHHRFRVDVSVYGHLHRRTTRWRDGVRFEEVSLGYPKQWRAERPLDAYLREILPAPAPPAVPVDGAPLD